MKRLHQLLLLILVSAVAYGFFEEARTKLRADDDFDQNPQPRSAPVRAVADPNSDAPRQQLLERLAEKVRLMNAEEVRQALQATDADIRTMQAKQQLDQTAAALRALADQFEGTPSAAVAKRMLDAMNAPTQTRPL